MRRVLAAVFGCVVVAMLAALVALASPVLAGGWAVTTLDELPTPAVGSETAVGFTIRQHGVSPVNVDDVGITLVPSSGTPRFFRAEQSGPTGHYVARVVFSTPGSTGLVVTQGWFGEQDLGRVEVIGSGSPAPIRAAPPVRHDDPRWPAPVRFGLPALGLALLAFAAVDLTGARWRRRVVASR